MQTDTVAYYKVGRTDNVTRRLDEWKKRKFQVVLCYEDHTYKDVCL